MVTIPGIGETDFEEITKDPLVYGGELDRVPYTGTSLDDPLKVGTTTLTFIDYGSTPPRGERKSGYALHGRIFKINGKPVNGNKGWLAMICAHDPEKARLLITNGKHSLNCGHL